MGSAGGISVNRGEWEPTALASMKDPWPLAVENDLFHSSLSEGLAYERERVPVWLHWC